VGPRPRIVHLPAEKNVMRILSKYLIRKFLGLYLFCVLSVIVLFMIIDLVQFLDEFIDKNVPRSVILQYYTYYIPYILVLTLPVATLLSSVFSISILARNNEMVALKSLGYSLYQVIGTLLIVAVGLSIFSFGLSEGIVAETTQRKMAIEAEYLKRGDALTASRVRNLKKRIPPDEIITIGQLNASRGLARHIKIEKIVDGRLVYRLDADTMMYKGRKWMIGSGIERFFDEEEKYRVIRDSVELNFHFSPEELVRAQGRPQDMGFFDLRGFIRDLKASGSDIDPLMTELHIRIAFPISHIIIVLLSVPAAYNRRRRSIALGFGISLAVCFFYFGLVKLGQTLGQNGKLAPFLAAWMGNGIMTIGSVLNLVKTRK
jgi:lipopolysaccharide export system permease protein